MPAFTKLLLVALGGAIGAVPRYVVSGWAYRLLGPAFPWGTFAANLIGCFAIGFLWALSERVSFPPETTPFLFTGVIGAFTTFSTYGLESINLLREGELTLGLFNILASNLLGLLLVVLGFVSARYALSLHQPGGLP